MNQINWRWRFFQTNLFNFVYIFKWCYVQCMLKRCTLSQLTHGNICIFIYFVVVVSLMKCKIPIKSELMSIICISCFTSAFTLFKWKDHCTDYSGSVFFAVFSSTELRITLNLHVEILILLINGCYIFSCPRIQKHFFFLLLFLLSFLFIKISQLLFYFSLLHVSLF